LIGRTHFGGAFLLLPAALALSAVAERTLSGALGGADKARRLVLSLFFRAALGVGRIFHFETLDDPGFAILSGGKKVMSRSRLGSFVRAVKTAEVKRFARVKYPRQSRGLVRDGAAQSGRFMSRSRAA
jgi:hypothetical protein